MDKTAKYIKANEGLRLKPYKCTAGKLTIGYGRNLEDVGITVEEAEFMLETDIARVIKDLDGIFSFRLFCTLSNNRQRALTDMMFNLGRTRFKKFKKMIKAVKTGDFKQAASELMDSRYAKQVPSRAHKNADLMRGD